VRLPSVFPTAHRDAELIPFRPGLVFGFFNALAWQIGIGTPMVLFAEQLGASPAAVGVAYSFVFLLTPVQIVSTPLVPRYGFKRTMLGGWRTRSFFLSVPVVLAAWAQWAGPQPWMIGALVGSVFFFCFFRSIGASAAISWFIEILPPAARGRYFAYDQFVSAIGGVLTLLSCAALFRFLPVYSALLAMYSIAAAGSIASYYSLCRLPDAPRPGPINLLGVLRDTPRHLFTRTPFSRFLWLAVVYAMLSTSIPPFAAYYLRVAGDVPPNVIMLFEVLRYSGVMTSGWLIRQRIDRAGAKPFFQLALLLFAVVGACWWLFLKTSFGGLGLIAALYYLTGLGAAVWAVANLNYLPKVSQESERTLMVSIHGATTSFIGGLSPLLLGFLLKHEGMGARAIDVEAFAWFFAAVALSAVALIPFLRRLPEHRGDKTEPLLMGGSILRPLRGATYLVNLFVPRKERNPDSERKGIKAGREV
jgi:MFS family permease